MPCEETFKNVKVCNDLKVKGKLTVEGKSTLGETKVTKDLTVQGTTNVKNVLADGNISTTNGYVKQGIETKTLVGDNQTNVNPNLASGITVIDCTSANYQNAKGTLGGSNLTLVDGQPKHILVVNSKNSPSYTLTVSNIEGGSVPIDFAFGGAFGNSGLSTRFRSLSLIWSKAANNGNGAWVNAERL